MFFPLIFLLLFLSIFCCPDGSVRWNNYCYIFDSNETEYTKAEIICQRNGGHLASIHDAFTNALIAQNPPDYIHQLWIGANSLSVKNVWDWTDGSNFDFNDWKKGEPKNTSDSMCVSVSVNDGYWNAESCFTYKPFVCEILNTDTVTTTTEKTLSSTTTKTITTSVRTTPTATDATLSPPPLPLIQNCSSGWTYFAPAKSFYCANYTQPRFTWQQGEDYCKSIGGHLTSIHSDLENRLIWAYELYIGCGANTVPWLGLYTVDNGTTYQWTDGSSFDFQKWLHGYHNVNAGACVIMNANSCDVDANIGFANHFCSLQCGVICKKA